MSGQYVVQAAPGSAECVNTCLHVGRIHIRVRLHLWWYAAAHMCVAHIKNSDAGGEAELMFHYKEKQFINGDKQRKSKEWFSDKVNLFNPSVFAGIQLPGGMNVKFKYYLNDFLNQAYTETVGGVKTKPYSGLKSQKVCFLLVNCPHSFTHAPFR